MGYRMWRILVLVCLLLSLTGRVYAAEDTYFEYEAEGVYVFDLADVLTAGEETRLEKLAEEIAERYGCGVFIVTLRDFSEYGGTVLDAAERFFLIHELGVGSDRDGALLLLSMAERDYALIAHGEMANRAFTDYGKDLLSGEFLDDFRYDDWFDGFEDYITVSADFLQAESEGTPVDRGRSGGSGGISWVFFLMIPAAIAGVSCGVMASSMKTAKLRRNADDYILRRGIRLTGQRDRFINRTVVRQRIETESSGGTKVNSEGFSGRSGKF